MMSYALSITRQTKVRAVVAMAAASYNLPGEPTDTNAAKAFIPPLAWKFVAQF